ncbi:MAG TPA: folylpolyglutamate synthase/dihydrofolate synthase family protein [Candidatus Acidoferrales bacterium]|nr:folylpolyglutamate synthase/dihydrofolate synthase family protein [Candidatus Acidoferrales bacterium]
MTYREAVRYLLALGHELAAPRQARVHKFDLENIRSLTQALGQPHRRYPSAHIAGTNGKGSTAAFLDSILRAAGLATGLYTSPHLERINERIRVGGQPVPDEEFARSFTRVRQLIERLLATGELAAHPTYFECLTAMAFEVFARRPVDFAVLEVGMGGRLDATNVIKPEVAIITSIDFDHESYLGHSIEEIAAEKAGIIKPGIPVVSAAERAAARAVIVRRAEELAAPVVEADRAYRLEAVRSEGGSYRAVAVEVESGERIELAPSLEGRYQLRNALAAAAAARLLARRGFPLTRAAIERGIAQTSWAARLERMGERPALYLDGSHNPAGARELVAFWSEQFPGRRLLLVYGAMRDKAVDEITGVLFPRADRVIFTAPHQPRAISAEALAAMSGHLARQFEVIAEPAAAVSRALDLAGPDDVVFVTGSLYLAGDLRPFLLELTERGVRLAAAPGRAPGP